MTKSKQKMATQRFSGPELGELLDQVVAELGPSAEISEVNKIRSGGVAGFFCREEYEIIVDARPAAARSAKPAPAAASGTAQAGVPAATATAATAPAATATATAATAAPKIAAPIAAEQLTDEVGSDIAAPKDGPDGASEVFGGPRPRTMNGTDERFLALLEQRLDETSEAETLVTRRPRRPAPKPTASLPRADVVPQTELAPIPEPPRPAPSTMVSSEPSPARRRSAGFWARVSRARRQLTTVLPEPSPFLAVIGPLSLTTPVIKRLRADSDLANAEVIVLTDRAEIVSEPNWQLVRSGHQLIEVANERNGEPTLLVLDVPVDLPQWVAPLQQRLRRAGVGACRYAVPGTPSAEQLDRYRLGSDVPYILDLVSRVEPDRLVTFVDQQHPIGSVGGAVLTAELLVAMQEQVGIG